MAQYINKSLFPQVASAYSGSPKETAKSTHFFRLAQLAQLAQPYPETLPRDPFTTVGPRSLERQTATSSGVAAGGHPADAVWLPNSAPNAQPEMSNNNSTLINEVISKFPKK